jgi:transposase InsO family protein
VFFSFVIDVYSQRIVGWQFASHMRTHLVLDALRMALTRREHGADVDGRRFRAARAVSAAGGRACRALWGRCAAMAPLARRAGFR